VFVLDERRSLLLGWLLRRRRQRWLQRRRQSCPCCQNWLRRRALLQGGEQDAEVAALHLLAGMLLQRDRTVLVLLLFEEFDFFLGGRFVSRPVARAKVDQAIF
jgi:hypothetical protein